MIHVYSEIEIFENGLATVICEFSITDGHAGGRDLFRIREIEGLGVIFINNLFVFHSVQHLNSALHHGGQDLIGSEFVYEHFGFFPFLLDLNCFFVVIDDVFSECLFISVIIAFIVGEFLVFEENGLLDNVVEELSVMGDYQNSNATMLKIVF